MISADPQATSEGQLVKNGVEGVIANAQATENDYIANTFSQFGLNINLLMGVTEDAAETAESGKPSKDTKSDG